jgi:hypothetical protein
MNTTKVRDEVFLYQAASDEAWLVTIRGDFAEMLRVNPEKVVSRYERYEAPLEKIREAVSELRAAGYTLSYSLSLDFKKLIEF